METQIYIEFHGLPLVVTIDTLTMGLREIDSMDGHSVADCFTPLAMAMIKAAALKQLEDEQ